MTDRDSFLEFMIMTPHLSPATLHRGFERGILPAWPLASNPRLTAETIRIMIDQQLHGPVDVHVMRNLSIHPTTPADQLERLYEFAADPISPELCTADAPAAVVSGIFRREDLPTWIFQDITTKSSLLGQPTILERLASNPMIPAALLEEGGPLTSHPHWLYPFHLLSPHTSEETRRALVDRLAEDDIYPIQKKESFFEGLLRLENLSDELREHLLKWIVDIDLYPQYAKMDPAAMQRYWDEGNGQAQTALLERADCPLSFFEEALFSKEISRTVRARAFEQKHVPAAWKLAAFKESWSEKSKRVSFTVRANQICKSYDLTQEQLLEMYRYATTRKWYDACVRFLSHPLMPLEEILAADEKQDGARIPLVTLPGVPMSRKIQALHQLDGMAVDFEAFIVDEFPEDFQAYLTAEHPHLVGMPAEWLWEVLPSS